MATSKVITPVSVGHAVIVPEVCQEAGRGPLALPVPIAQQFAQDVIQAYHAALEDYTTDRAEREVMQQIEEGQLTPRLPN